MDKNLYNVYGFRIEDNSRFDLFFRDEKKANIKLNHLREDQVYLGLTEIHIQLVSDNGQRVEL